MTLVNTQPPINTYGNSDEKNMLLVKGFMPLISDMIRPKITKPATAPVPIIKACVLNRTCLISK
jgi:hypothetical protein